MILGSPDGSAILRGDLALVAAGTYRGKIGPVVSIRRSFPHNKDPLLMVHPPKHHYIAIKQSNCVVAVMPEPFRSATNKRYNIP